MYPGCRAETFNVGYCENWYFKKNYKGWPKKTRTIGTFTQSYLRQPQIAETLTLYTHKWECPHVNDKWSLLKLVASRWFSVALSRLWLRDFLWRDHWLYIIIYVSIHTINTSGHHKIRKYKNFIFSWTRSLIKPRVSLQWLNLIFQLQVATTCGCLK